MGTLVYLAMGLALACGMYAYVLPIHTALILAPCALILTAVSKVTGKRTGHRPRESLLLGLALGSICFFGFHNLYLNTALQMDGEVREITVRATDYSYETNYGSAVDGRVVLNGKPYSTKLYLDSGEALEPGDTLTGSFRFRVTIPGGSEPSSYHKGRGTFLLMYQSGDVTRGRTEKSMWRDGVARLRKTLNQSVAACFPEDTSAFAKALLLGDTTDFDYETDTNLKLSGIRHVAAVSGLHVSILYSLIGLLTLRRRRVTILVGLPALFLFAALAGFSPSVTRACLMLALMLTASLLNKTYRKATGLAFAVFTMLLCNPLVITDVGFQLSVGSVAGIFLFSERVRKWILEHFALGTGKRTKLLKWFAASVSITLSAQFFTIPLCAWYFGTVSILSVVTNLLTLWVITAIFCGTAGVCVLNAMWHTGAMVLARGIAWPIRYVLLVAKAVARIPVAAVYTHSPYIVAWLIFVYVLLGIGFLRKMKRPGKLCCIGAMGLCVALLLSWTVPMLDQVRFTVLDVGQGQCLLFQSRGYTFLVDCGGDRDAEAADIGAEALLSQGITRLDGLILTHGDRDHTGGVEGLLSRVDTDLLILPAPWDGAAFQTDAEVVYADETLEISFGTDKIRIYPGQYLGTSNENSLCVLFDTENCDILITGDRNGFGERTLLRNADIPKVDVLVAGHHGSKNATCQELLTAVKPEIVCISAGRNNSFGHPAQELLERLEENNCTVYRTDVSGDILIRR